MARPTDRATFAEYCLRRLGKGAFQINITPDQIQDRIDDALDYVQRYHHDFLRRTFHAHQVTAQNIADQFIILPDDVESVSRVFPNTVLSALTQFNQRFVMTLTDAMRVDLTSYYLAQQNIAMLDSLLTVQPTIIYQRHDDKLSFEASVLGTRYNEGDFIIIECFVLLDPATTQIWKSQTFMDLGTAYMKRQWGENIKKFGNMQLPGGLVLNGDQIYTEALAEISAIQENFIQRFQDPDLPIIG